MRLIVEFETKSGRWRTGDRHSLQATDLQALKKFVERVEE